MERTCCFFWGPRAACISLLTGECVASYWVMDHASKIDGMWPSVDSPLRVAAHVGLSGASGAPSSPVLMECGTVVVRCPLGIRCIHLGYNDEGRSDGSTSKNLDCVLKTGKSNVLNVTAVRGSDLLVSV